MMTDLIVISFVVGFIIGGLVMSCIALRTFTKTIEKSDL